MLRNQIDKIRLLFHKDRESYFCFYKILGFFPRNIRFYEQALLHKSTSIRSEKGRPLNNERLEFLGDAILDAIVGDIVYKHFEGRRADGTVVLSLLEDKGIDFIVLAGFLARVPDCILHAYPNKIINIHPSLLPKFGGKGMYGGHVHEAVVAAGETETGITIHYLNEHFDEGEIIVQYKCPVLPQDTAEDVAKKVHALEYEYYPKVIGGLLSEVC